MKITIKAPKPHSKKQEIIMHALAQEDIREVWIACGSKLGKALRLQEKIPSLHGMTTMEKLQVGDYVFDENGKPTRVIGVTEPMYGHKCHKITFSNGHTMVADAGHLWEVESYIYRKNKARTPHTKYTPEVLTTEEISKNVLVHQRGKNEKRRPTYSIRLCGPAQHPDRFYLIPPYLLGVWLGDGTSSLGEYTKPDEYVRTKIEQLGYKLTLSKKREGPNNPTWKVAGLKEELRDLGLLNNKHIPDEYLYGSVEQRFELLRGLMDTDGTVDAKGNICFDNTNKNLADGVAQLCASLGIKTNRSQRVGKYQGVEKKMCYRVWFSTDKHVFSLPRKLERIQNKKAKTSLKSSRIYIDAVEEVPSEPVKCIKVENPTGLFLASEQYIVTHNSLACATSLVNASIKTHGTLWRWVAPIYLQTLIGKKYVNNLLPGKPWVRDSDSGICPQIHLIPNNSLFQFFHGQKPETLEGEGVHGYVLDEAAKMKEEVYESAYTTTTVTKGRFLVCSTPLGKNWFYKKCMNAKDEMTEALKAGQVPRKLFITAPTATNPYVDERIILEAKKNLPDHLFRQYFLAEFVDQSSVFYGFRDCVQGPHVGAGKKVQVWLDPNSRAMGVVIGADWAKQGDWTVFTAWATEGKPRMCGFVRFQDDYMASIKQLVWFAKQFARVHMVRHDRTGIGDVLDEILSQTNLSFEGMAFTNESKSRMVNTLILAIQQRKVAFPNWPTLVEEFDAYEVVFTELGKATYSAPDGGHDDVVSSALLGYSCVEEYSGMDRGIIGLESSVVDVSSDGKDIPKREPKTADWFSGMLNDDEDDDNFQLFIG